MGLLPNSEQPKWKTEDTDIGTKHSLEGDEQYYIMEDDGKTVLGKGTLVATAEFYQVEGSSVLASERDHTEVSASLELVSLGETEIVPDGERRIIHGFHAIFLPYFGYDFEDAINVEDAKKLALVCRDGLAGKLSTYPAESPTVRGIQRFLRIYESGPEDESDSQKQERVNRIIAKLKVGNAKDTLAQERELADLESALSETLHGDDSA